MSADERQQRYESAWQRGELLEVLNLYTDVMSNPAANDDFAEFVSGKIRATVHDPQTADALCPSSYPIGAKRLCLDTDYYAHVQSSACAAGEPAEPAVGKRYRDRNRHGG